MLIAITIYSKNRYFQLKKNTNNKMNSLEANCVRGERSHQGEI